MLQGRADGKMKYGEITFILSPENLPMVGLSVQWLTTEFESWEG
jgi:hypothetical protein